MGFSIACSKREELQKTIMKKKYKKQCSITGAVNSEPVGSMAFKMEDRSDNLN